MTIAPGWNLIDLPVQSSTIHTLADLVTDLNAGNQLGSGAIKAAATYTNGRFTLFVPGFSTNSGLEPIQGIFVLSTRSGVWRPAGSLYTAAQPVPLQSGWNLVAAPYPLNGMSSDVVGSEVNATGCTVNEIATYSGGIYHTWTPFAIDISPTAGLWIETSCPSAETWLPS